jgi:putative acetyltransferase
MIIALRLLASHWSRTLAPSYGSLPPMRISLEHPNQPEIVRLIDELDAYQKPLYPAESHHGIDMDALCQPNVFFAVVRTKHGEAVGCGAVVITPEYGELKRMFIRPTHRGKGLAKQLLIFLENQACANGCSLFTLETGIHQPEALGLYERSGYVRCEPFGDYTHDPMSVFMEKRVKDV